MKSFITTLALLLTLTPSAFTQTENSGLYIKVGEAKVKKSLMAIPPFQYSGAPGSSAAGVRVGKELFDVFRNDMDASGFFDFLKPDGFLEDVSKVGLKPAPGEPGGFSFSTWAQSKTEFLVRVGYRVSGNELAVDAYVYFVPQAKLVLGKTYKATIGDVRTLAHTFSNDLVKAVSGQTGFFLSRIVVARSTRPGEKEIFVLDWDGANAKQVTSHKSIAVSPTWSFDGKKLAYSAFTFHANEKSRNLDLFTYDLASGKRFIVSYRRGINSGASFLPDNRGLLLTISNSGNPDIYRMTTDGKSLTPLTKGGKGVMNVEPVASPDGRKIAFSSDRGGNPMIYVMDIDGSNVKRLTFAGKYNSGPAWSPDSKRIAFAGFDYATGSLPWIKLYIELITRKRKSFFGNLVQVAGVFPFFRNIR
ncbi:MAG: hypothetical protein V4692_05410, partial [Bdellovibrionota bacterium]